jgi:hypothetical protein
MLANKTNTQVSYVISYYENAVLASFLSCRTQEFALRIGVRHPLAFAPAVGFSLPGDSSFLRFGLPIDSE